MPLLPTETLPYLGERNRAIVLSDKTTAVVYRRDVTEREAERNQPIVLSGEPARQRPLPRCC